MPQAEIDVFPDKAALTRAAAEHFVAVAAEAIGARGRCLIALAGGSTPKPVYELLATAPYAARVEWGRVHLFWGDERCVPPDHPESNYRMTREALLDRAPIPPDNVHRISGEREPDAAADAYERLLRKFFPAAEGAAPAHSFDLELLGLGHDGHTASIFPGSPAVAETRRWAMAVRAQQPPQVWRVTLTPPVLNAAANVAFLVSGADKAARLQDVLRGGGSSSLLPAQLIQPTAGSLRWMVDAAAAASLPPR
jgi:6-phosphogluconolactonase